jgi:starch synthase (maltosyl-transferring)
LADTDTKPSQGRARVVISGVSPEVDCGRFPAKAVVGEPVEVEADIFTDGHDAISARLLYRREDEPEWTETPMEFVSNDRWRGSFPVTEIGRYRYTLTTWVDRFQSWRQDLRKRVEAGDEDIDINLAVGANLIAEAGVSKADGKQVRAWVETLKSAEVSLKEKVKLALSEEVAGLMDRYSDRRFAVTYPRELEVVADREKALFGAWYEMFPRSCSDQPGQHGTFEDCEARLPYFAGMGFDVLYLPPIHPVGRTLRKGKNNAVTAAPGDPGTPWAIGSEEGGHKAVNPELGTLEDFRHLVAKAGEYGLEVALDIALHCSPDHPYLREHPEWFVSRPDGTIQYAENPPKKYQDIYPFDFECQQWRELWEELKSIFLFWIEQGVHIFRVDNPHTKPFTFWEWLIAGVKGEYPNILFLAEAFTRPRVMYRLAKLGFSQSYTYFAWRNTREELTQYLTELTQSEVRDFYRPNFWPNTPDILTEYLQTGGRPAFMARLVLAATLSASYGIYGPAFELGVNTPREKGSEEYLNSEKYEIKQWDINRADSLKDFIARVNRIRQQNPALRSNRNLWFHAVDNNALISYSKHSGDLSNIVLVVVNLDPHKTQSGWVHIPIEPWRLDPQRPYQVSDLLNEKSYLWHGADNYVELDPGLCPAHIYRVIRQNSGGHDFNY